MIDFALWMLYWWAVFYLAWEISDAICS